MTSYTKYVIFLGILLFNKTFIKYQIFYYLLYIITLSILLLIVYIILLIYILFYQVYYIIEHVISFYVILSNHIRHSFISWQTRWGVALFFNQLYIDLIDHQLNWAWFYFFISYIKRSFISELSIYILDKTLFFD